MAVQSGLLLLVLLASASPAPPGARELAAPGAEDTEFDEALRVAQEAVRQDPDSPAAQHQRGVALRELGRLEAAAEAFKTGLGLEEADPQWHNRLHLDLAITRLLLAEDPTRRHSLRRRDREEAVALLDKVLSEAPKSHLAHFHRGQALDGLDRPGAADQAYRRCIGIQPHYTPCFSSLARMYLGYGFEREAFSVLKIGLEENAESGELWATVGRLHREVGESAKAIVALEKAMSLRPDDALIVFHLGMAYADSRERHKAVETLHRFLSIGEDEPEYLRRAAASTIARMQDVI